MKQHTSAPPHGPSVKVPLWIETTPTIKAKLFALAEQEERSVNQIINRILRRHIAAIEKQHGMLLSGESEAPQT